jgi:hypothetical protein
VLTKYRGDYATTLKPMLGAYYRFHGSYGVELNLVSAEMKNIAGQTKTGTMLELALWIYL